jgi:hypothetical protein
MILIFTAVFYYAILPGASLFSVIAGIMLTAYAFKGILFMLTGSISLTSAPFPQALEVSLGELLISLIFMTIGALMLFMYVRFCKTTHAPQSPTTPQPTLAISKSEEDEVGDDFAL